MSGSDINMDTSAKDVEKSAKPKDEEKSENLEDEEKSENLEDEEKSENLEDEEKSENLEDEEKSENLEEEEKSENLEDEEKSENLEDEEKSENLEEYWHLLFLLADGGENLVKNKEDSLQAQSLKTIFKLAIQNGDVKVIRSCFMLGVDVNAEFCSGYTPLQLCIDSENRESIKTLIELGADVNLKSKHADAPLHYAVENGKTTAADALLTYANNNVLVNSRGKDGLTPLLRAAKFKMRDMIRVLGRHGADPNMQGEGGATALHMIQSYCSCGSKEQ